MCLLYLAQPALTDFLQTNFRHREQLLIVRVVQFTGHLDKGKLTRISEHEAVATELAS